MQEQIKAELKPAMIAKDSVRVGTIRLILAAFTNELVTQGRPPTDPLSDEDVLKVVKRLAKQRKDSIDQFVSAGRPELAEDEKAKGEVEHFGHPRALEERHEQPCRKLGLPLQLKN
jgi:uncharacterized protein YqeY